MCRWAVRRWLTEYDDLGSGTCKRVTRVMLGPCGVLQSSRGNSARAIGGVRRRAARDQVVDDTFMHPSGLKAGHPRHPVQSSTLPGLGNVGIALNSHPHHRNAG